MVAVVVCPLKTRDGACAGAFPSRYPAPLASGCKKPHSSLERERKVPTQIIWPRSAPTRPDFIAGRLRGAADSHSRVKMVQKGRFALMFAEIQDPLEPRHLSLAERTPGVWASSLLNIA